MKHTKLTDGGNNSCFEASGMHKPNGGAYFARASCQSSHLAYGGDKGSLYHKGDGLSYGRSELASRRKALQGTEMLHIPLHHI